MGFLRMMWASKRVRIAVLTLVSAALAGAFGMPPEVLDAILNALAQ